MPANFENISCENISTNFDAIWFQIVSNFIIIHHSIGLCLAEPGLCVMQIFFTVMAVVACLYWTLPENVFGL